MSDDKVVPLAEGVPVEWIGALSPINNVRVRYKWLTGQLTLAEVAALKQYARDCRKFIRAGNRYREVTAEDPAGFSRAYRWERSRKYVALMTREDAARLFASPVEAEFKRLDLVEHAGRRPQVPSGLRFGGLHAFWRSLRKDGPHVYRKTVATVTPGGNPDDVRRAIEAHKTHNRTQHAPGRPGRILRARS